MTTPFGQHKSKVAQLERSPVTRKNQNAANFCQSGTIVNTQQDKKRCIFKDLKNTFSAALKDYKKNHRY